MGATEELIRVLRILAAANPDAPPSFETGTGRVHMLDPHEEPYAWEGRIIVPVVEVER